MNYASPIKGTLTNTTLNVVLPNPGVQYPLSIVLNSAELTRSIQLSFDDGVSFLPAITPTLTATGQLVYVLTYPATTVKFTGAADDTYAIL